MGNKFLKTKLAGLSCAFLTACATPPNILDYALSSTAAQEKEYASWLKESDVSGYSCETPEGRASVQIEEKEITLFIARFNRSVIEVAVPTVGNEHADRMNFYRLEQRVREFCG
jgi:hypothetical protein